MEGIMRAMVFTCWVSSVLAAHDGTAGSSYGNSYMYGSECDGSGGTATSEPTRPTVGRSCKTMNDPTNDTPTDVQLRTTDIAVTIRQGEDGQPDQYRWATIPRNFDSTTWKQLNTFSLAEWSADKWPVCAAAGQKCDCPNGRVAIFDVYDPDDNFQISSATGDVQCNAGDPAFQKFEVTNSDKVYCRCGQPLTPEEQWSTFTDNCLETGSRYRTANGIDTSGSCMGLPVDYNRNRPIGGKLDFFPPLISFVWKALHLLASEFPPTISKTYCFHFAIRCPTTTPSPHP